MASSCFRPGPHRAYVERTSAQWQDRVYGPNATSHSKKTRRRLQPHWLLDRTSMEVLLKVVWKHRNSPHKMLFILVAVTWGFIGWRNVELGGGIEAIESAYESFSEDRLRRQWENVQFRTKGYDSNISLEKISGESWVRGFIRYLYRFRACTADELLVELQQAPESDRTMQALQRIGGLSHTAAFVTARHLGAQLLASLIRMRSATTSAEGCQNHYFGKASPGEKLST